jgi:hypothetical protein
VGLRVWEKVESSEEKERFYGAPKFHGMSGSKIIQVNEKDVFLFGGL